MLLVRGTRHQPRAPEYHQSLESGDLYWMGTHHQSEMG
jgi:hypothetical protein